MLILDPVAEPAFNLAAEQYLHQEASGHILRLWRNTPCVVIGRHQIPCMEVRLMEAQRRGVPVLRRATGGGAVYHDLGNINYTLAKPLEKGEGIDFDRTLTPVLAALTSLGIPAEHRGRGDVRLRGLKISGSAAGIWRGRVIHHGTLLYDADLGALEALLEVGGAPGFEARGIRSIRSRVCNLKDALPPGTFTDAWAFGLAFAEALLARLPAAYAEGGRRDFSDYEASRIRAIREATFATDAWNSGASPAYALERELPGLGRVRMRVEEGRITSLAGISDNADAVAPLAALLKGRMHDPQALATALAAAPALSSLPGALF
jgi:lipoate-protein ligase A